MSKTQLEFTPIQLVCNLVVHHNARTCQYSVGSQFGSVSGAACSVGSFAGFGLWPSLVRGIEQLSRGAELCWLPNGMGMSNDSYLVDPASSHMLVSKIKPCMSKYKHLYCETANGSLNQLSFI